MKQAGDMATGSQPQPLKTKWAKEEGTSPQEVNLGGVDWLAVLESLPIHTSLLLLHGYYRH